MFVLKIWFSVVADDPVCIGWWVGFLIGASNLSSEVIVKSLEKTFTQVHVANRVDTLREFNAARQLAVTVAPLVFDALHVPLVH